MDAAPQSVDMSRAGWAGARSVAKHTIMANPKATAWLIAALVVVILVLAVMLRMRKEGFGNGYTTNFHTGGNQNQAMAMGGSILDHTGATASVNPDSYILRGGMQGTSDFAQGPHTNAMKPARIPGSKDDVRSIGLLGMDTNSARAYTDLLGSDMDTQAIDAKLGSMCSGPTSNAMSEHHAHKALNGGLSGGAATPDM